jgi:predicted O-methyltransferase YrrM
MTHFLLEIPKPVLDRMHFLEEQDARDRQDNTPQLKRLRQVPPETGMLLAILAASAPEGQIVEIGASAGYSALWLSLACKQVGAQLTTFELLPEKAELARETFERAQVADWVQLQHGDARGHLSDFENISFCFLDAEKEMYAEFYELVVPRLVAGGFLVADNVVSHVTDLKKFIEMAYRDKAVDTVMLPVGKGLLLCRKQES